MTRASRLAMFQAWRFVPRILENPTMIFISYALKVTNITCWPSATASFDPRTDCHGPLEQLSNLSRQLDCERCSWRRLQDNTRSRTKLSIAVALLRVLCCPEPPAVVLANYVSYCGAGVLS
jgi:hypothetical protein